MTRSLASLIQTFNPDDYDLGISKHFQLNTMHFTFTVSTVCQINLTRTVLAQTILSCAEMYSLYSTTHGMFYFFVFFHLMLLLSERPYRGITSFNTKRVLTLNVHL